MRRFLFLLIATIVACPPARAAGEDPNHSAEEEAIRKAVQSYVTAFNAADASALSALWTPEAVYTNPLSGFEVTGREAIEEQFASMFAEEKGVKLEATTESVRFISPGVAVENGVARLLNAGPEPLESTYTAIYVKRDGQWLLDRVTEEDVIEPLTHYEHLKPLEWLVGSWKDQDEQATVVTECHWTRNNNFLVRSFTVQVRDRVDMAGMQVIGWDPSTKTIRSWVFDSDGGFGQGTWKNKGDRWYIQQDGVLADGSKASAMHILTRLDDDACTFQAVNRTLNGELLPNIDEVKITKE